MKMPNPDRDAEKRQERAEKLRRQIDDLSEGKKPRDSTPTPREISDEAARESWEKAKRDSDK
jgi:hypothetical protein